MADDKKLSLEDTWVFGGMVARDMAEKFDERYRNRFLLDLWRRATSQRESAEHKVKEAEKKLVEAHKDLLVAQAVEKVAAVEFEKAERG